MLTDHLRLPTIIKRTETLGADDCTFYNVFYNVAYNN